MKSRTIAFGAIIVTFLLLVLGALVHNTESSLACPDWPLCYGSLMPEMKGGVLVEHSHRLLATFVGLLTIALLITTFKYRKTDKKKYFYLSCFALFLVMFQGLLGGLTVIYRLPTIVSTAHLGTSMLFFMTLIYIHHQFWIDEKMNEVFSEEQALNTRELWNKGIKDFILLALILVYLQIILGAFLRHAGAGPACGTGFKNSIQCFDYASLNLSWWPTYGAAKVHMLHRYVATILGLFILALSVKSYSNLKRFQNIRLINFARFLTVVIPIVIISQICFGILTVADDISVVPTTFHLIGAALLLGLIFKLFLTVKTIEKNNYPNGAYTFLGDILSLTKPKLASLVMLTTVAGFIVAPVEFHFLKFVQMYISISLLVAGAATLNCYIEKDVDKLMQRTKMRPLPDGRLGKNLVLVFGLALVVVGLVLISQWLNSITAFLGFMAALFYLVGYTPLKQKSELAVYVGAIPGALPPLMGWTAATDNFGFVGVVLFLILFVWQIPHFMAISIYHTQDYDNAGIKIYPTLKGGKYTAMWISITTFLLVLSTLIPYVWGDALGKYFFSAIILGGTFFIYSSFGLFISQNDGKFKIWARRYFWGSIIYLPLILVSFIYFKT